MKIVNVNTDNTNLSEILNEVVGSRERIVIEQEGKAKAAIISYKELKRLEQLEAILLKKAEQEEYEWLRAVVRSPALEALRDSEEDIYTLADGKPFHDPEWDKTAATDFSFPNFNDTEEEIYTLADGNPFQDEG